MVDEEYIPIDKIKVLENIRTDIGDLTELIQDIKHRGLLQPIGVWKENDDYYIVFSPKFIFDKNKLEKAKQKYKLSLSKLLLNIIDGKIPPMKGLIIRY